MEEQEQKIQKMIDDLVQKAKKASEEYLKLNQEQVNKIIKATTNVLEQTPPELAGDIVEKGIILTGGGALLNGLCDCLEKELNVPILIAESPLTCVAEGTGILLDNIRQLEKEAD